MTANPVQDKLTSSAKNWTLDIYDFALKSDNKPSKEWNIGD